MIFIHVVAPPPPPKKNPTLILHIKQYNDIRSIEAATLYMTYLR